MADIDAIERLKHCFTIIIVVTKQYKIYKILLINNIIFSS